MYDDAFFSTIFLDLLLSIARKTRQCDIQYVEFVKFTKIDNDRE